MQPGLNTYNPLIQGIRHYSVQNITAHSEDESNNLTSNPMTADQQTIKMTYVVMYRLPENQLVDIAKNYQGDPFDNFIAPRVNEAIRQVVSQYKAADITSKAEAISNEVQRLAQINTGTLADVSNVSITHFELPAELQEAIAQKQVMQQDALKKQFELQKAQTEAKITVTNAQANAESIKLQTAQLQKSPQYVTLQMVNKWDGKSPNILVTGKGGPNMILPINQ